MTDLSEFPALRDAVMAAHGDPRVDFGWRPNGEKARAELTRLIQERDELKSRLDAFKLKVEQRGWGYEWWTT